MGGPPQTGDGSQKWESAVGSHCVIFTSVCEWYGVGEE